MSIRKEFKIMDANKKANSFFKFNTWLQFHPFQIKNAELRLLLFLCYEMDWSNCVILDNAAKINLQANLQIKDQQFNKLMKSLEAKKLIFKKEFRVFVNEEFAKKGK